MDRRENPWDYNYLQRDEELQNGIDISKPSISFASSQYSNITFIENDISTYKTAKKYTVFSNLYPYYHYEEEKMYQIPFKIKNGDPMRHLIYYYHRTLENYINSFFKANFKLIEIKELGDNRKILGIVLQK